MASLERISGECVTGNRWRVFAVAMLLVILGAAGMRQLMINNHLSLFFSDDGSPSQALVILENSYASETSTMSVVASNNRDVLRLNTPVAKIDPMDAFWKIFYSSRVNSVTNSQHARAAVQDEDERPGTVAQREKAIGQSCSKANPECIVGSTIALRGPGNTAGDKACTGFKTELFAVIGAMNEYNPRSIAEDREFMGVILHSHGQFFYSVTPGKIGSDKISIRLQKPIMPRIAALWHTHGSYARERVYFSDIDTRLANSLNKRFYLGDPMGSLRVFKPGGKVYSAYQARRMGLPSRQGFSAGKLVQDGNYQAVEIAYEHPNKPPEFRSEDSGFIAMCLRKPA